MPRNILASTPVTARLCFLSSLCSLYYLPSHRGFSQRASVGVAISIGLIVVAVILALFYILPAGTLLAPVLPLPLVGIPLVENGPAC